MVFGSPGFIFLGIDRACTFLTTAFSGWEPAVQVSGNSSVCGGWLPPLMLVVRFMPESLNGPRLDLNGPLWAVSAVMSACLSIAIYLRLLLPVRPPPSASEIIVQIHDFRSPLEEWLPYYGIGFVLLAIVFCRISWYKERASAAGIATVATAVAVLLLSWAWHPFFG